MYVSGYEIAKMDIATSSPSMGGFVGETWDHQAGYTCFTRTIDTERYPFFDDTKPVMPL